MAEQKHQQERGRANDAASIDDFQWRPPTAPGADEHLRRNEFLQVSQTDPDSEEHVAQSLSSDSRSLLKVGSNGPLGSGKAGNSQQKLLGADAIELKSRDRSPGFSDAAAPMHSGRDGVERNVFRDWALEFTAWTLATVSLIAVVGLLAAFNDMPLDRWHSRVSINAFVAVLTQTVVSALLLPISSSIGQAKWIWFKNEGRLIDLEIFDLASRGPEGSTRFLFNRRRFWQVASVGALLTIFMLSFQPFSQQAVNIRQESRNSTEVPRIGRANQCEFYGSEQNGKNAIGFVPPPSLIQAATMTGIIGDDITPSNVLSDCPTANCTWEPYTTLGFCHTVEDISTTVIKTCGNIFCNATDCTEIYNCNYTSSRLRPAQHVNVWEENGVANFGFFAMNMVENRNPLNYSSEHPLDGGFNVFNATVLYRRVGGDTRSSAPLTALTTTVRACLQVLETKISNGTISTHVKRERDDVKWTGYSDSATGTFTAHLQDDADTTPGLNFTLDFTSLFNLGNNMELAFNWTGRNSAAEPSDGKQQTYATDVVFAGEDKWADMILGAAIAKSVYGPNLNDTDPARGRQWFQSRMDNFTASLTNTLRTHQSLGGDNYAAGTAHFTESIIHVEFEWLIVPLILWVTATAFFFWTVGRSARRDVPLWKSSPLALLHSQSGRGAVPLSRHVRKEAAEQTVRLTSAGRNWRLVTSDEKGAAGTA